MRPPGATLGSLLCLVAASCAAPMRPAPSVAIPAPVASQAPAPAPSASPDPPAPSAPADEAEITTPCVPDSAEHTAAQVSFHALDKRIEALPDAGDPSPDKQALAELLATRCFKVAGESEVSLDSIDSALSLKTFWASGGKWWVAHALDLGDSGPHHAVVPPTPRTTLAKKIGPTNPLAAFVCPLGQPACGQETQGWAMRAEQAFVSFAKEQRARSASDATHPVPTKRDCAEKALATVATDTGAGYFSWRACISQLPVSVSALRLGRTRAPKDGWLIVRGRRGHYHFCDEVRAYDLATGAAYVAQSCSGLALTQGGGVDHGATDAARARKVEAGKLSAENLREAVWMALFADEVDEDVRLSAETFPVPRGLVVRSAGVGFGIGGRSFSMHSGQTRLAWSYVAGGKVVKSGSLTYPEDLNDASKEHALSLLLLAEASFEPGCPPAPLPSKIEHGSTEPGVSHLDATAEGLRATEADLTAALDTLRRAPACARTPRAR